MSFQYQYTVNSDETFLNKKVDIPSLTSDIQASSIVTALDGPIQIVDGNCVITFKAALSQQDLLTLEGIIFAHTGVPVAPVPAPSLSDGTPIVTLTNRQSDGTPLVASSPRLGTEWVMVSHNFSDQCTWFGESVRVTSETLVDSGDGYTFNSDNPFWIDMISGRMHNDTMWVALQKETNPSNPHGYQVIVKINGTTATMREPFTTSGGDFEVIWDTGQILFYNSQSGNTVTADYSYAKSSAFYVQPRLPNTILSLEDSETDITTDVVMCSELEYTYWESDGYTWTNVGGYSYKRVSQILAEAVGAYPITPAIGATAAELAMPLQEFRRKSRGTMFSRQVAQFSFKTPVQIGSNFQIRISLKNDVPLQGEFVLITFYCIECDA